MYLSFESDVYEMLNEFKCQLFPDSIWLTASTNFGSS